jgi:hypothetical protein
VGFRLIPSRQVWWFAPGSEQVRRSRDWRQDGALLRRGDVEVVEHDDIPTDAWPELAELYAQLYLRKYSRFNPAFTAGWMQAMAESGALQFTALRDRSGRWLGVEGRGMMNGVMTSPIVGYDLAQPVGLGLYRRLAAVPVLAAQAAGVPLNLSAGVGRFKALRGGEARMEYLAVYDRHQPAALRAAWAMIEAISRELLLPYVRARRL